MRAAVPDDAPEVVRLAELMYRSLGMAHDDEVWAAWRRAAAAVVRLRLGPALRVVVAERPAGDGRLVACGAGTIVTRLPNPSHADARVGYVQWMSTDVAFRRRGLGRAVLEALLAWYEEAGVDNVELHASPAGVALYRSAGFWEGSTGLALRRRPWDPSPGP
ncbi:MAG TPA: GNAT family N-acetyltransferase [Acidimicrobiales bacterium]|nr:GNAT family N-acetyltransferase [Acidimicrobiales bacterium]